MLRPHHHLGDSFALAFTYPHIYVSSDWWHGTERRQRKERVGESEEGRERGEEAASGGGRQGASLHAFQAAFSETGFTSQERKEADRWGDGAKGAKKGEDKEAKRLAELARRAENARLLAEEEASTTVKKTAPKAGAKKSAPKVPKPAGPGAIAAGGGLEGAPEKERERSAPPEEPESFAATGLDNALDLLEIVTAKMDKASVGQRAAGLEQHPEVRMVLALVLLGLAHP